MGDFCYHEDMAVKVRIAPSPTGNPHIGTAFTALFNWLFARKNGGQFLLRIEDTDKERSKKEYEAGIFDGIRWLGLDWDNEQVPRQSERTEIYREHLQKLLDSGKAFWRQYTPEEKAELEKEGRTARDQVIVLKDDGDPEREIAFDDIIRGRVSFLAKHVGQLVIAKSLDEPIYHFAVVVDDIEMGITHVLRGEEHLSNTPKQLLIYQALGATPPQFAHLPLMLGADRSKLSKRNGDVNLLNYEKDYLPEALVNFLASLSYTFDKELLTRDEMIQQFDLARVHKTGAVFDTKKLNWYNAQYVRLLTPAQFREKVGLPDLPDAAVPIITERLERLSDVGQFAYLWQDPEYDADLLAWKGMAKEDSARALKAIQEVLGRDGGLGGENGLNALVETHFPGNKGAIYWPLRVALAGHGFAAFIAALFQHPQRRHVAAEIVGVGGDPGIVPAISAFEPQRVIHHHFASQREERICTGVRRRSIAASPL